MKAIVAVVSLWLVLASSAFAASSHTFTARSLSDARVGTSKTEVRKQMTFSSAVVAEIKSHGAWRYAAHRKSCWSHVPWAKLCDQVRSRLNAHRWLYQRSARIWKAKYAPVLVGHVAGWSCITNGATPHSAHEGNGYNGSYTGWLGMTTPWLGHNPPASDWVHSDQMAVYAIAESEAAARHWSDSFMRGQWPQTYPPCADFFH